MAEARVLWVGSEVTGAPRSGGAIRSLRLLEGLARRATVDLVITERSRPGPPLPVADHLAVDAPSHTAVLANALGRRWPLGTARSVTPEVRRFVETHQAAADHVVVEWAHLFPLVPRRGPYLLSLHNVEAERMAGAPRAPTFVRRWFQDRDAPLLTGIERRLVRDPRCTVVCVSARDRDLLGIEAAVVPNGADVPAAVTAVPATGDVLFVGAMDYPPNRLAVEWWAREVWPLLPSGTPPLSVAGRAAGTVEPVPGVRVLGELDDVGPALDRAALVAVPLRHGGGTRLKILEAYAANRPVVTTAKGVEGLDPAGCVVADDPAAFAAAVVALLGDLPRRRALAKAGRTVAAQHNWVVLGDLFAEVVLSSPRRLPE